MTYTHIHTKEEVTLIDTIIKCVGTPTPHVVLRRKGKPNLTITKREFERDWKINLVL